MKQHRLILVAGALVVLGSLASAQVIHKWDFDETAGTLINNTANTGTAASGGAPTWGALINSVAGTDWATTGTGAFRLAANDPGNVNTLVQSVVTMPNLNTEIIRFEWDLSWDLASRPGTVQETFLINRNQGGSNRFRWTLGQLTGTGDPGMYLVADVGVGATTLNGNMGASGNAVLRADFTFVAGAVTAVATAYSLNGGSFIDGPGTANATLLGTGDLNDLRLHSKGRFDSDNYLDINSVTITLIPEPATMAALLGLGALGLVAWRRRAWRGMAPLLALALVLPALPGQAEEADVVHQWTFDEAAGTNIQGTANSGSAAVAGAPTWGAFVNGGAETKWQTTGAGALRLETNRTDPNTLVQSAVTMPGLSTDVVRFEWDVSWSLENRPGVIQETYLINRNQSGSNRFRWTLQNPSGEGDPLFRLNLDGVGFAAINNVTATQHDLTLPGSGGNLVLRTDFTFGDVGGSNSVVALAASYSYNGGAFVAIDLGTFTPYAVPDLNELRIHSKGALSATDYLDFHSVTVTGNPAEPPDPDPDPEPDPDLPPDAEIIHRWPFNDAPGTLMTAAANTGTIGGVSFAGGNAAWTTNGLGSLTIKSDSGESLIQSNANMGEGVNGVVRIQYDVSWNFAVPVPGFNREVFLISRTSSGTNPSGNQFRFALSNWSPSNGGGGFVQVSTQRPGFGDYISPVQVAPDLEAEPAGSVSLRVTYTWNTDSTILNGIVAEYSLDSGGTWTALNLGGAFTPYSISNLGDLRIHAKGPYNDDNYYSIDAVTVTMYTYPDEGMPVLEITHLGAGALKLQWPAEYADWEIGYSDTLNGTWIPYAATPAIVGDTAEVTVPAEDWDGKAFFRLAQPAP